jgi:hypothetical protein
LDGAKSRSSRDVPVGREARVHADIDDDGLDAFLRRPAARRPVVIHHGKVIEEFSAEAVLDGDPQRTGFLVEDLDVPPIGAREIQCPFQDPGQEQSELGNLAQILGDRIQPPRNDRLIQVETSPPGELLGLPRQFVLPELSQPDSRAAVQGLGFLEQPPEFPVLPPLRKPWKRFGPSGIIPASIHNLILPCPVEEWPSQPMLRKPSPGPGAWP